jgi:hypothetical protein
MYILFYLTVICIPVKSHQSNKTCSTTLQSVIGCEYSSYLNVFILVQRKPCAIYLDAEQNWLQTMDNISQYVFHGTCIIHYIETTQNNFKFNKV